MYILKYIKSLEFQGGQDVPLNPRRGNTVRRISQGDCWDQRFVPSLTNFSLFAKASLLYAIENGLSTIGHGALTGASGETRT